MHVSGYPAEAIESGAAALARDSGHPLGPDLPFPATVGPEDAVAHRGWREACERALAAVLSGPGVVLVLGPAGTGKTLLLQHLAGELRARGMDVLLSTRGYFDPSDRAEHGQPRAVLIDEADRLSPESLEGLGHLGRCAFVLAGVTEPHEESGPIAGEGASIVRLAPLPAGEVGAFVAARLVQSGLRPDIVTEAAIERLAALSAGVPRLLNMLTGSALFLARTAGASHIEAAHVSEAAALREGPSDLAPEPPAEPSPPAEPQPSDAHPPGVPAVIPPRRPLRAPPLTLTGNVPPMRRRPRRGRRAMAAIIFFVAAGLATACVWFLVHPEQRTDRAMPREAALEPAVPPSSAPAIPPAEPAPKPAAATSVPASGQGAPASTPGESGQSADRETAPSTDRSANPAPAETRSRPRHRSDHPQAARSRPRPEAPASSSGVLELPPRLREATQQPANRSGVLELPPRLRETTQQGVGSLPRPASPQSPEPTERRPPQYIGTYSMGPDGVRRFQASP